MQRSTGLLLLAFFLLCGLLLRVASADIAPLSPEQLQKNASTIVVGVVSKRAIALDATDPDWDRRSFHYEIKVEAIEKGDLQVGDTISANASSRRWVGTGTPPPSGAGHWPLPLEGERARFFLHTDSDGTLAILLPNGVELSTQADRSNPVRFGDPPPPSLEPAVEKAPPASDPFGWDVMLILLALPLFVGGFRQDGKAKWALVGIACLMCASAVVITLFYR